MQSKTQIGPIAKVTVFGVAYVKLRSFSNSVDVWLRVDRVLSSLRHTTAIIYIILIKQITST